MRLSHLIAMVFLYSSSLWSQHELIGFQGFEPQDSWGEPAYSTPPCIQGDDYWGPVGQLGNISPSQGTLFWGVQDLNGECGSNGFEWLELPEVDVTGYQDVICRLDYRVEGYDAGDDIELEPWFDGEPQERIVLVDGAGDFTTSGWVEAAIEVPNRVNAFKLRIYVKQNGTDQAGIDNIRLEGIPVRPCTELLISEYVEGSSSANHRNNFIEIYNPAENEIELNGYALVKYTGSNLLPSSRLDLSGSLSPFETYLIEDDREILGVDADLSTNSAVMNFNGDDKIVLQFEGQIIDAVGVVGDSLDFGRDVTLRRKSSARSPNTEFNAEEWDVYGLETTGNLNRHQSFCSGPNPEIAVYGLGLEIPDGKTRSQMDDNTYFGYLETGSPGSANHDFLIKNTGTADLQIESIDIEGVHRSDFRLDAVIAPRLAVNDSLLVRISFSPGGSGVRNAALVVNNSDPSEGSYEFLLQGEGTSYTESPLLITMYYEGESNNRWLEVTNISGNDIVENSFYLALYRQDLLNSPIRTKPSVKKAIPHMQAGATLTFRATLNVSEPAYALDGSEITTGVCGFNGDDVLLISPNDDESCWENRVDLIGRSGQWGKDIVYLRKYGCQQEGPHSGFNPDHWWPFSPGEIDSAQPGINTRLGEYYSGNTSFYENSWSNGLPDLNRNALIRDDLSIGLHGNLNACSLTIEKGSRLTVESGHHVAIQNDLKVSGILEIMHGGELLMVNNSGLVENDGEILVHRTSSALKPYDYTYWSSPVRSADLTTVFRESDPRSVFSFSTPLFADDDLDGEDDNRDAWVPASGSMLPGKGYAVMAPDLLPSDGLQKVLFPGEVNNGYVDIPIEVQAGANPAGDWNLIGNPYPSAIDAEKILADPGNANLLGGSFYFWTHNTALKQEPDSETGTYSSDDYAMFTVGMGGIRASSGGVTPDQFISVGQGFFIEGLSEGTLRLRNEMRTAGRSPHFFKPANSKQEDVGKVWLNLFNDRGAFSQILIGFREGATAGFDKLYDGPRFSANSHVDFYSTLDSLELAIRGEPAFRSPREIPLGVKVKTGGIDSLFIGIDRISGTLGQTEIHLWDHLTGIRHDLRKEPYGFTAREKGAVNDRFRLMLGEPEPGEDPDPAPANAILWFMDQDEIKVRTRNNDIIENMRVFDMLGRLVLELSPNRSEGSISADAFASNSVYVLQLRLPSGQLMTTKILHLRP